MTDEEWEAAKAQLIADCPLFFRHGDPTPGAQSGRNFYFEISRGWHAPVRKACLALERIAEKHEAPEDPYEDPDLRPRAAQIKEKFGGLRLYINGHSDEAAAIVDTAEAECAKLCEACGEAGRLRNDLGWITTLCDTHYAERAKK